MADSIRELIIQSVQAHLEDIVRYSAGTIARGRTYFRKDELPGLAIFPGVEESVRQYGRQKSTMPVEISAAAICGDVNCSELAETLQAEIIETMLADFSCEAEIESLSYTGGGVDDWPDSGDQAVTVTVNFEIVYETVLGDPYNQ